MLGEGEWKIKKHGAEYRRHWRKVHLVIDAETMEIRAIEVTSNRVGDAYDTKRGHTAIAEREAEAIIPVRKNGKPWKENTPGIQVRNETLCAMRRLGRAIWKNGVVIIAAVWWKPKCVASNFWANESMHDALTARSPSYRFGLRC